MKEESGNGRKLILIENSLMGRYNKEEKEKEESIIQYLIKTNFNRMKKEENKQRRNEIKT